MFTWTVTTTTIFNNGFSCDPSVNVNPNQIVVYHWQIPSPLLTFAAVTTQCPLAQWFQQMSRHSSSHRGRATVWDVNGLACPPFIWETSPLKTLFLYPTELLFPPIRLYWHRTRELAQFSYTYTILYHSVLTFTYNSNTNE